jgi:predicted Holliday junction resolvase-like endonuclease
MDTQLAFAFGVLTVVVITLAIAVVICTLKVIKHEAGFRNIHSEINDTHRRISDTERYINNEINETRNRFDRYTEEFRRESVAYTDSRVDKLEQKLSGTTGSKQILKD